MIKLTIITIVWFFVGSAHSQVLSVLAGSLLIDKAGHELRESIDHAREAGMALLERGNQLGKERLDQVDAILRQTVGGLIDKSEDSTLRILANAKKKVDAIREKTILDLKGVIWDAECGSRRLVISDLDEALGKLGSLLNTHQIRLSPPLPISLPLYCSFLSCSDPNIIDIKEPFGDTYIEVRNKMEKSISHNSILETTPAHRIVGTYEYLSGFALKTSCFYPGSSDVWNREYLKYREVAAKWRNVANIAIR